MIDVGMIREGDELLHTASRTVYGDVVVAGTKGYWRPNEKATQGIFSVKHLKDIIAILEGDIDEA